MIRIAIVEDEENCIKKETEIIKQYFVGKRIPYDIAVHMNVEWFHGTEGRGLRSVYIRCKNAV